MKSDEVCPAKKSHNTKGVYEAQRKDWAADRNVFDGKQDPPAIHYLIFCLRSISPDRTQVQ